MLSKKALHSLVAIGACAVVAQAQDTINDTYFYGESPPVYPSPQGTGTGDWAAAYAKAEDFVSQLTVEEKVSLTGGIHASNYSSCSGIIPSIERLDFPGLCVSDAGNGLRTTNFVSAWPAGISVGASWNRKLARERGVGMANEFRKKGVNMLLGPVVGPVGRIARGGRNWEGFSNDPYLCGALAFDTVESMQSAGVMTSTKHFIGNEQETNRNPTEDDDGTYIESVSSNIDDKTMHEMYLWPFQDAVKAGTGSIMCSYNRVNNSYGCANSKTQNGLLKTELGFQGIVISDWYAQHAGVATALAGLDMVMPYGSDYWGGNLTQAVNNGSVPEWRLTDMATRTMAAWYQFSQDADDFPPPGIGMPADLGSPHKAIIATDYPATKPTLLRGAVEGHVLVKNSRSSENPSLGLPLESPQLLSIFGYSAAPLPASNPDSPGWNMGSQSMPSYSFGQPTYGQYTPNGTMLVAGGSGANEPAYMSDPLAALSQRAYDENTHLWWDFNSAAPTVDQSSSACLVFGNAFAAEGIDRLGIEDEYTDALINHVADQCRNTIVVLHNAGLRLVDGFVDHENVTAILYAHLPGQDSGRATTGILYGDWEPSGRLPYSVPKTVEDLGNLYAPVAEEEGSEFYRFPQDNFTEGVFIDYRAFDKQGIEPRFEFGFGLGYTSFEYSGLSAASVVGNAAAANTDEFPTGEIVEGGREDLWDVVAKVEASVTNTGGKEGAEVAQLYVGIPGGDDVPVRQLRGFEKVTVKSGGSATVEFDLTRRDLSVWDVVAQEWRLQKGEYKVYVGSSSRKLPLEGALTI